MCLAATVMLARVKVGPLAPAVGSVPAAPRRPGRDGWFGFRPLLTIPVVRGMMLLTLIYYISYGPLLTAVPVYAGDRLHTGGAGYGAMWSVMGVGALAGLVAIPRLARLRPAVVNAVGVVLWGVVLLPLVVVTSLPVALVIMFVGGVVWAPYAATEISVLQSWVPGDQLGAVFGARRSVIVASSPSGAALGGLLLERMSSITVIGLSAGACVVGGLACLALPAVRRTPAIGAETAPDEPAAEPVA